MAGKDVLPQDSLNVNAEDAGDAVRDKTDDKADSYGKSRLPLSRMKGIIKMDPEVKHTSQDSVFLLSKATELFIQQLASDAATKTLSEKKKTITKQHLDHVFFTKDCYSFLEGILESFET